MLLVKHLMNFYNLFFAGVDPVLGKLHLIYVVILNVSEISFVSVFMAFNLQLSYIRPFGLF
jgi:hypothetical protein